MRSVDRRLLVVMLALPACDDGGGNDGTMAGTTGDSDDTASDESGSIDPSSGMGPWASLDERPCPPDSFLTSENFGGPYLLNYCTGCHHSNVPADLRQGAPVEINFDTLDAVRDRAPAIWRRAADQNATMPPVGAPAEDERTLFGEWLACGAPTDADLGMQ